MKTLLANKLAALEPQFAGLNIANIASEIRCGCDGCDGGCRGGGFWD